MRAVKYFTNVLPDGRLSIPEEVRKELVLKGGEKLEVILSYITIKSKEEEIKTLQRKIQEEALKRTRNKLTISKINQLVHEIRKINA